MGVALMGAAVVLFVFLPWLDRSKVKSIRYRGWLFRSFLGAFAVSFIALGYLGLMPATPTYTLAARFFGVIYFAFFLLMPWYTRIDQTKPVAGTRDLPCPLSISRSHDEEEFPSSWFSVWWVCPLWHGPRQARRRKAITRPCNWRATTSPTSPRSSAARATT